LGSRCSLFLGAHARAGMAQFELVVLFEHPPVSGAHACFFANDDHGALQELSAWAIGRVRSMRGLDFGTHDAHSRGRGWTPRRLSRLLVSHAVELLGASAHVVSAVVGAVGILFRRWNLLGAVPRSGPCIPAAATLWAATDKYHAFRWTLQIPHAPSRISAHTPVRVNTFERARPAQVPAQETPAHTAEDSAAKQAALEPDGGERRGLQPGESGPDHAAMVGGTGMRELDGRLRRPAGIRVTEPLRGLCGMDVAVRRTVAAVCSLVFGESSGSTQGLRCGGEEVQGSYVQALRVRALPQIQHSLWGGAAACVRWMRAAGMGDEGRDDSELWEGEEDGARVYALLQEEREEHSKQLVALEQQLSHAAAVLEIQRQELGVLRQKQEAGEKEREEREQELARMSREVQQQLRKETKTRESELQSVQVRIMFRTL